MTTGQREEASSGQKAQGGLGREEAFSILKLPPPPIDNVGEEATAVAAALAQTMNASLLARSIPTPMDPPRKCVKAVGWVLTCPKSLLT